MPPGCRMTSAAIVSPQAASSTRRGATHRSTSSAHCTVSNSNSLLMSTGPPVRATTWMVRFGAVRDSANAVAVTPRPNLSPWHCVLDGKESRAIRCVSRYRQPTCQLADREVLECMERQSGRMIASP